MARVSDVEIDAVPDEVKPIYERYASEYGPFLNQVRVFAHRPPAVKHIMGLLLDLKDEQVLPRRYLEIALVTVSKINECRYCVAHHMPRLIQQGLPLETATNILEPNCPGLDEVDRLVLVGTAGFDEASPTLVLRFGMALSRALLATVPPPHDRPPRGAISPTDLP